MTIQQTDSERVTMKIEGKVAGVPVPELQRAWRDLALSLGERKLLVDLRGVTHVDESGRSVLAEIFAKTRAEFLAETPLAMYFAEDAQQRNSSNIDR